MIPVYQDEFGFGKGNCAWACLASIFERELSEVQDGGPPSDTELAAWTVARYPDLVYTFMDLGYDYETVPGPGVPSWEGPNAMDRWTYKVHPNWEPPEASVTGGYWMATVPSQRLKRPPEDPYYPMPALHAVVMLGRECVHDPNPQNSYNPFPQVIALSWWTRKES